LTDQRSDRSAPSSTAATPTIGAAAAPTVGGTRRRAGSAVTASGAGASIAAAIPTAAIVAARVATVAGTTVPLVSGALVSAARGAVATRRAVAAVDLGPIRTSIARLGPVDSGLFLLPRGPGVRLGCPPGLDRGPLNRGPLYLRLHIATRRPNLDRQIAPPGPRV
jgi:hypothetical protein